MKGLGPLLPLGKDVSFGPYTLITSYKEEVKQNFKNLLLTSPGERVMNPDFGVGLRQFLFEPRMEVIPKIKQRIVNQTNKYMPFININDINFGSDSDINEFIDRQTLSVQVIYEVPTLNLETEITIDSGDIN